MSEQAWEAVATGEQAAVYGYGVLASKLPSTQKQEALDALDDHRTAHDRARAALAKLELNPSTPVVFDLPFPVTDTKSASELAVLLELRLADLYLALVRETEATERKRASEAAQSRTVSATRWGWIPTAFPTGAPADPNVGTSTTPSEGPASSPDASSPAEPTQSPPDGSAGAASAPPIVPSTVSPNDGATLE